jgi:hypothetical protein
MSADNTTAQAVIGPTRTVYGWRCMDCNAKKGTDTDAGDLAIGHTELTGHATTKATLVETAYLPKSAP